MPDQFRNTVSPVLGRGGVIWLLVQTELLIQKYSGDGELLWSRSPEVPEVEEARREFFRRNAEEQRPSVIVPLSTMAAGREVNGHLWVLMRAEAQSQAAVFYVLDGDTGDIERRITVDVPAAVNQFAIDPHRSRLYLTIPAEASVLAADLTGVGIRR